jgi:serine/alanine adding enzyme
MSASGSAALPLLESIATHPVHVTTDVSAAEWDAFLESHPDATVEQLWAWRDVFERVFEHRTVYLAARRDGRLAGVLPLVLVKSAIFGRSVVSLPYANYAGLIASDDETVRALVRAAEQQARAFDASHVELRHIRAQSTALPTRSHKVGSRLSLPATADALWTALDRKVRNQVRKAEKEGLQVVRGGLELTSEFYDVFSVNMRDLGTPVFSLDLFREVVKRLPGVARVFVVRLGSQPIAGGIALTWRGTTLVPWASALREHRSLCANMLLYWSMLQWAIGSGSQVFDFGRSTADGGTHHFKRQWGATDFPLSWEYVLLSLNEPPDHGTSSPKVERFIDLWKQLPLWLANALGPSVVRHVS